MDPLSLIFKAAESVARIAYGAISQMNATAEEKAQKRAELRALLALDVAEVNEENRLTQEAASKP